MRETLQHFVDEGYNTYLPTPAPVGTLLVLALGQVTTTSGESTSCHCHFYICPYQGATKHMLQSVHCL